MPHPIPQQAQAALEQFRQALRTVEGRDVDPLTASWAEIEASVIKLLGGAFTTQNDVHRTVALMVSATLAARLSRDLEGFWFPHRGSMEGAALGFPDTVVMLSPLEAVVQALSRARLSMLDDVFADVRTALARAKLSPSASPARLGPEEYRRLFDPGFIQFVCLDVKRASPAWDSTPAEAVTALEDAFRRFPARIPADMRESMRRQIVGAFRQFEPGKRLGDQVGRAAQLLELLALVHGGVERTGFAPVELWQDVLLPLLHIGAADSFPPVDEEELGAFGQGADPLLVYVEVVPFQSPAADEDGMLGVFPSDEVVPVDPCFATAGTLRLAQLPLAPIEALCARFEGAKVKASVERFRDYLVAQAAAQGKPAAPASDLAPGAPALIDIAVTLLDDLARAVRAAGEGKGVLCLRQATESEAASDEGIEELRQAMQGPRIILA